MQMTDVGASQQGVMHRRGVYRESSAAPPAAGNAGGAGGAGAEPGVGSRSRLAQPLAPRRPLDQYVRTSFASNASSSPEYSELTGVWEPQAAEQQLVGLWWRFYASKRNPEARRAAAQLERAYQLHRNQELLSSGYDVCTMACYGVTGVIGCILTRKENGACAPCVCAWIPATRAPAGSLDLSPP
jgi:hypothetical protein